MTIVALLVILASAYVVFVPARAGTLGQVAVSILALQTNANGQVGAMVAISNQGPTTLDFSTGTEIRDASAWVDASGLRNHRSLTLDADPALSPGQGRVVSVWAPARTNSWRVVVTCAKQYPRGWRGRLGFIADGYVLKRQVWAPFHSAEVNP